MFEFEMWLRMKAFFVLQPKHGGRKEAIVAKIDAYSQAVFQQADFK